MGQTCASMWLLVSPAAERWRSILDAMVFGLGRRKYIPDELTDVYPDDPDATDYVARPLVTETDLREYSCMIRKWFYHQGIAVPQIVERLRIYFNNFPS